VKAYKCERKKYITIYTMTKKYEMKILYINNILFWKWIRKILIYDNNENYDIQWKEIVMILMILKIMKILMINITNNICYMVMKIWNDNVCN